MYAVLHTDNIVLITKIKKVWHRLDYHNRVVINKMTYNHFFQNKKDLINYLKTEFNQNNKIKIFYTLENKQMAENITSKVISC